MSSFDPRRPDQNPSNQPGGDYGYGQQPGDQTVYDGGVVPPEQGMRLSLPLSRPWAYMALLIINVIIFAIPALLDLFIQIPTQFGSISVSQYVRLLGAKDNVAISQFDEYYRFLTSMFLHGGILHIAFNAYALFAFGAETERLFGTPRFLAAYFISGLAGGVASYALTPNPSVGASGAIFGMIGALAAFYYVSRDLLGQGARQQLGGLLTIVMINLFIGFSIPLIDNWAHIGGLIGGAALGWLLAPRYQINERFYPPQVERGSFPLAWAGSLGILALLIGMVMVINPPIR